MTKTINYAFLDDLNNALGRMSTLTGRVGYAIMKNHIAIETDIKIIYQMRDNLIQKYGKDGQIKPGDEGWNDFVKEYAEFLNDNKTEVDIFQIDPEQWNDDAVYCEHAQARDYTLVKSVIVKSVPNEKPREN